MDMSLDDIIRNRKLSFGPTKRLIPSNKPILRKTLNRPAFKEVPRIVDARTKIIQKNREKIRDARDKLAEITRRNGDIRHKLTRKHESSSHSSKPHRSSSYKYNRLDRDLGIRLTVDGARSSSGGLKTRSSSNYKPPITTASLRRNHNHNHNHNSNAPQIPRGYVDYDNMEKMEEEEYAAATNLFRTVRNDAVYEMPPPAPRLDNWGSNNNEHYDPFDVYEVPVNSRHERNMSPEIPPPPKGILRPSSVRDRSPDMYQQRHNTRDTHLSYNMRSRLERAPDPHASMGIFSYPSQPQQVQVSYGASKAPLPTSGCRIVVSNLHLSVTQSDIKELFEDIGELYDSRLVKPGVAEIIYKSVEDAEKAVDTYHNRQLDGLPMKCLLVSPRASNKPTAPAMRSTGTHSSNKTPLEIDIDALHKVLFRRH